MTLKFEYKECFVFIISILLLTNLAILLDFPFLRQVFGFLCYTILPGALILFILKLNKIGFTEKIVLAVGLSIAFLMFFGLFINSVYPLFGYNTPLSTNSVIISFSVIILILAIIAYVRNRSASFLNLSDFKLNTKEKAFLLVPAFFPLLSILGMRLMNTTDNNVMLMALLFLIPAYAIFIAVKHTQVPDRVYPPMVFFISISFLLMFALLSNHIYGSDSHMEYYIFQLTSSSEHWQIFRNSTLDACLSISIFPTIYQSLLNLDPECIFKFAYVVPLSMIPLLVYIISKKYIGSFYAFLASLFLMSQGAFYFQTAAYRTYLAIFFFALAIMVLFCNGVSEFNKRLLFIIFATSCIVSHYSTSYIFLFVLLLTWLGLRVISRVLASLRKPALSTNPSGGDPSSTGKQLILKSRVAPLETSHPWLKSYVTIGSVGIFFTFLFFWYSQVTGAAFTSGVDFFHDTFTNLQYLFVSEMRSSQVSAALGTTLEGSPALSYVNFVTSWLTVIFIAIGVLTTSARYRHMVALPNEEKRHPPEFINQKLEPEFIILAVVCSIVFAVSIALPYVFVGYSLGRAYYMMMVVLSPFFVIGGVVVARFLRAKRAYLIVLIVLIPYFMSSVGILPQIFATPCSPILNSAEDIDNYYYIYDCEASSARWLKNHAGLENVKVYTDATGRHRLISTGLISSEFIDRDLLTEKHIEIRDGYIYLRYLNVVNGILYKYLGGFNKHDIAEYQDKFIRKNLIYNSGSEIWR
jgi:uncharacterized membrane protein